MTLSCRASLDLELGYISDTLDILGSQRFQFCYYIPFSISYYGFVCGRSINTHL